MTELLNVVKPAKSHCFYPNAEWATAELLKRLPLEQGDVILEPCCGDDASRTQGASASGAIAKVLLDFSNQLHVFTNDVDIHQRADFHFDMTREESWKLIERSTGGFDWAIGHPPSSLAPSPGKKRGKPIVHSFVQLGYQYARKGVVFLLKKSFTEPVSYRRQWLQTYSHEQFLELRLERISVKSKGRSNEAACDWYGWQHGHTGGFVPEYIWRNG